MTETDIKREITNYLKSIGYKVKRTQSSRISKRVQACEIGTLDLFVIGWDGVDFWLEIKAEDGKLRASQTREIEDLKARGQTVYIVRSVDEVKHLFEAGIKQGE